MKRALVAVIVLVVALAGAGASSPGSATVYAIVWQKNTVSLATLDATTLAQRGRLLALGRASGVTTDRLGDRLAVASATVGVVVVDTRRMRILWRLRRGPNILAVSWLSPNRLLVVEHGSVLLLDPLRRRLVGQRRYEGVVTASARWSAGLVLVAVRNEGSIEPARVLVIGPGLDLRQIELARIPAGSAPGPTTETDFNYAQPGLAVDRDRSRAFVAGGQQLATIDLGSLAVAYSGAERTEQKLITGPRRSAAWLGDGVLAVAGTDERWTDTGGTSTPFGLRIVTGNRVSVVEELATEVSAAGELALAYGQRNTANGIRGIGLAAYHRTGALRWRLFGDAPITALTVVRGLAYVRVADVWNVVEVASGAIVGQGAIERDALGRPRWGHVQILG